MSIKAFAVSGILEFNVGHYGQWKLKQVEIMEKYHIAISGRTDFSPLLNAKVFIASTHLTET